MKHLFTLLAIILLTACQAGSGEGLNAQGQPINTPSIPITEPPIPPDLELPIDDDSIQSNLASIQEHVFTPICSTCHGGANPAAGQDLSSIELSAENLINTNSSNPLFKRVLPGSSDDSYLYLKITGDNQAGSRMPLGQAALPNESILAIKQWIDNGALLPSNTNTAALVNKATHSITSSSSNTSIKNNTTEFKTITAEFLFNKSMTLDALSAQEIVVIAINNGQAYQIFNDQYAINTVNKHLFKITINDVASSVSNITIQLNNNQVSTLLSTSGQILDGDKNGVEGGAYTYEITL